MFTGFERHVAEVNGTHINYVRGGNGPALLLLHGHPQTHVIWHKVAQQLAQHFTVIAADLRGYGDSGKPVGLADHSNYSKRTVGQDQIDLMKTLGFKQFLLMGHDRGGRVAYRMALDHPDAILKLVLLDIAPTLAMYEKTTMEFASTYYHWFFLIRPAPFPEILLGAHPEAYLEHTIGARSAGLGPFTPEAYAEYLRCLSDPATIHGICEDYRASASIDLEHERKDLADGKKIQCDTLVLWGAHGVIEKCFDPLNEWQLLTKNVTGKALDCGHYIPEEAPEALMAQVMPFFIE
ncbi:alpha/beta hydrolase [Glaciimonas sp. CA11.2]|uniref:alpha/beta fold hydrolase n=1 Tax=unclassified Glaciimonas TaxID=2644401 RepID=UPI002AB53BB0|nr:MULTISPECIES: alpha/beta hydrolase [unclassified Glaciimonas]MDY7546165.1 alpha/beta hydrolase [Glaciimonas sp. CA11.2]MEB0010885.1 alpha/beta hydrolase [Glaciimonas sp. Cout2]MEB0081666.1 alpha/beta hydrolase [Glaciimonas sp. Gout2]MEB0161587.1 alpha/beta hydrolase [Glaciimonas sp. CA11.2]